MNLRLKKMTSFEMITNSFCKVQPRKAAMRPTGGRGGERNKDRLVTDTASMTRLWNKK